MKIRLFIYKLLDKSLVLFLNLLPVKKSALNKQPSKILVIKLSAMGDCIALFPAIRQLALAFPNASLDWLTTSRSNPSYFNKINFISNAYVLPTSFTSTLLFILKLSFKLNKYDLIIDYDQYYRISELLTNFAKVNAGFDAPLKGETFKIKVKYDVTLNERLMFRALTEQVIANYMLLAPDYKYDLPELLTEFSPAQMLSDFSSELIGYRKPVVAIYPGSSSNASFRRWDIANYIELINRESANFTFVVVGGVDEVELIQQFSSNGRAHVAINKYSLKDLTWLFKTTIDFVVGNDGGVLHIAESQGVPSLGIFGPALFKKWGSINPKSIGIEIELECRPCLQNYNGIVPRSCKYGTVECLKRITVDTVQTNLRKIEVDFLVT